MQMRRLGRTDLSIAPLVLGGNVFGWTADKKASFAVLDRFAGAGLNAIDTADVYSAWAPGNSGGELETIIGEWMKARGNRGRVIVVTKVGSPMGQGKEGLSPRYIEEAVEASLKRLQADVIDLYLAHWPDMATPIAETLGAFQRLKEKGKIRWFGGSNLNVALIEAALAAAKAKGLPRYEVLQPEYNLADRGEFENGLAELCVREEIGVITYFSLAKGFLSGKYRSEADLAKSSARRRGQGVSQPPRVSHPRRARESRGAAQGQAGRGRARLGDGEAGRHRPHRKRHFGRAGRQPRPRDGAQADPGRHGGARQGQRALSAKADISRRRERHRAGDEDLSFRWLIVAQLAAQDLADRGSRQRIAELDLARRLVPGQILPGVSDEIGAGQRLVLAHHHDLDGLSGPLVGNADRADLEHARMGHQHLLDLIRIDIEPGHVDHVLLSIDHEHVAAVVDLGDVAGAQVTVGSHRLGGLVGPHPVAGHDLRALDAQFAGLAGPYVAAAVVANGDVGRGQRQADRAGEVLDGERIGDRGGRGFSQPVGFDQRLAGQRFPPLGDRPLHGHAAADRQMQAREIEPSEILVVDERVEERVDAGDHRALASAGGP